MKDGIPQLALRGRHIGVERTDFEDEVCSAALFTSAWRSNRSGVSDFVNWFVFLLKGSWVLIKC